MNYKIIENLFSYIFQLANENRLIVIILWVVIMFFLLRKLSKKDNEYYLKFDEDSGTITEVKYLDEVGRKEEIARMLSGENITEEARAAAKPEA